MPPTSSKPRLARPFSADHDVITYRAVDETYIRVGGKWRYLWRAIDANGPSSRDIAAQYPAGQWMVDFGLRHGVMLKQSKPFERVRLHRPVSICTDKALTYWKVIKEINNHYDPHFDYITHIDKKYQNTSVESGHEALKRLLGYRQRFRSLRAAKATLQGMGTIRTIRNGHIQNRQAGVRSEAAFVHQLFDLTA